jgi:hypothetical protein
MLVGERIPNDLLDGRRHGVIVADAGGCVWRRGARTRRAARRLQGDTFDWLMFHPQRAGASPGDDLAVIRVERRRIVARRDFRVPGEPPPDCGVREPRRPRPSAGGSAAVADPDA